jgi:hypothetical protein
MLISTHLRRKGEKVKRMFQLIDPQFNLQAVNFGSTNNRILIIALIGTNFEEDEWVQIPESRILLVGGKPAFEELALMLDSKSNGLSRAKLQRQLPGGMNGRTHTSMRKFVGL